MSVGDLIALPILEDPQGRPFDLQEAAGERPVVLLIGGDAGATAADAGCRDAIEGLAALLAVATPEPPPPTVRAGSPVAVDTELRFARSLGLVPQAGTAQAEPAVYVLAPCGRVTLARFGDDARRVAPSQILAALRRLALSETP